MRDILNKSLEMLIWVATTFFIISACFTGGMMMTVGAPGELAPIIGGFLTVIFGVTMSFVFAGIAFQIMDIREFTKHAALGLKRMSR